MVVIAKPKALSEGKMSEKHHEIHRYPGLTRFDSPVSCVMGHAALWWVGEKPEVHTSPRGGSMTLGHRDLDIFIHPWRNGETKQQREVLIKKEDSLALLNL